MKQKVKKNFACVRIDADLAMKVKVLSVQRVPKVKYHEMLGLVLKEGLKHIT